MKTQIVIIGGGRAFDDYTAYLQYLYTKPFDLRDFRTGLNWRNTLQERLDDSFDVLQPPMPNNFNARYSEWMIWFNRIAEYLTDGVVFIGHSLGGVFITKYLSENRFRKKIKAVFLLATGYNPPGRRPLVDFVHRQKLDWFSEQAGKIFIYHSKDDDIVPVQAANELKGFFPKATLRIFEGRGHLNQREFPELVADLKNL